MPAIRTDPWVFTKTLKPALALLRARRVRLIAYIDDILVLAESKELYITRPPGRDELSARVPGVHHQHGEVSDDPQPYHRVPWPHSEFNHYGTKPPTTKDKANSSGGLKTIERENHFS